MKFSTLALASLSLFPASALACGGVFCNATQPVNQAAERILFAQDGDVMHMHVRISYQGPPTEFGWLLPVPPDVQTELSSEQLFTVLDQQFGPLFNLTQEFGENCRQGQTRGMGSFDSAGGGAPPVADSEAGVNVLSREALGPYDRVILQADNVQVLRDWLDSNGFAIPDTVDATLQPYIEMGSVFVALKLNPGAGSGDVAPLHLSFTSDTPAIPIVPTQVAATPDMGLIVHVLDDARAVPTNYAHVQVNEAAIDWVNFGSNYADVVSAAADETVGGLAWVTDYAGSADPVSGSVPVIDDTVITRLRASETLGEVASFLSFADADVARVFGSYFTVPEGVPAQQYFQCPDCWGVDWNQAIDGPALAEQIQEEVNSPREHLATLFGTHNYLTRLYTTMSPEEMLQDPIFTVNADLDSIDRQRTATQYVFCDDQGEVLANLGYVETPSGLRFRLDNDGQVPDTIARQDGETLRGVDVPAAQIIERMFAQGQPEILENRTQALQGRYGFKAEEKSGCDCSTLGQSDNNSGFAFLALGLLGLVVRRRR